MLTCVKGFYKKYTYFISYVYFFVLILINIIYLPFTLKRIDKNFRQCYNIIVPKGTEREELNHEEHFQRFRAERTSQDQRRT